ncbi:hypothetical protein, partial [Vibrio diabolicus]|uniref:hypothetical protein n=1 Tax=Vibrio diabolicus TaxID=50719 RepID=UPI0037505D4D
DLQIDLRPIDCCVIALTSEVRKLRTQFATNPLNMGMFMIFPWLVETCNKRGISSLSALTEIVQAVTLRKSYPNVFNL